MTKDPRILLEFILECADLVAGYIGPITEEQFKADQLTQDAVFRRLEVIGQAVKDLPDSARSRYPHIPWRRIAGMRDKLSHDYLGLDLEITWKAATVDLVDFRNEVVRILSDLD